MAAAYSDFRSFFFFLLGDLPRMLAPPAAFDSRLTAAIDRPDWPRAKAWSRVAASLVT